MPPGGGQPAQDKDVVPDQRHQEHDRRQEDWAQRQNERQAEGGERRKKLPYRPPDYFQVVDKPAIKGQMLDHGQPRPNFYQTSPKYLTCQYNFQEVIFFSNTNLLYSQGICLKPTDSKNVLNYITF